MAQIHQQAIAHIRNDDWQQAHELIQTTNDPLACLIHGFLHRQEGDLSNASYWYQRAGETLAETPLNTELERLEALARR
ncbi:MAG: hypothetical protein R3341_01325 [Methylophaga sp.]|nr:hypothetical protein [Methylophaga sp.]